MHMIDRNSPCWCGSGLKYKKCHYDFDEKLKMYENKGCIVPEHNMIKTPEQIEKIKASARVNIAVLDYVAEHIKAGVTTEEIDQWVYEETTKRGAIPAPLNFEGFPKSVCTSINEVVCHGIPDPDRVLQDGDIINVDCSTILNGYYSDGIPNEEEILQDGDIINVDVSTIYKGYFSDSSRMFCIGDVSPEKKRLVEITKQSIEVGLKEVKPWHFLGDMGAAIHDFVRENGYSVVREIGGHGVGIQFHEEPWVSYVSERGTEMLMVPGMMFTIEPMVNMGKPDVFVDADDDWTVYTEDGKPSAQREIQVLVTEDGCEIIAY